jgi:hypothetical protein
MDGIFGLYCQAKCQSQLPKCAAGAPESPGLSNYHSVS